MDLYSSGEKFPKLYEVKHMVTLLEVILEKYKFVHPMNQNDNKLKEFFEINKIVKSFSVDKWNEH